MPPVAPARRGLVSVLAAAGVAMCAPAQAPTLADAQRSVFAAFPAADSYRVIVRDVDAEARRRVEALVPFRILFDELGEHSLYVALRGRRPLGMIYVQHEESAFGLAAVEWALTFDLRISGFRFQRARSKHPVDFDQSEFVRSLKECSRLDLARMLGTGGSLLREAKGIDASGQELAGAVVRSGVKSLAVLEVVWREEIDKLHDTAVGLECFPEATSFRRVRLPAAIVEATARRPWRFVFVLRVLGNRSRPLGYVAEVEFTFAGGGFNAPIPVRWAIDEHGVVMRAEVPPDAPRDFRADCNDIEGLTVAVCGGRGGRVGQVMRDLQGLLLVAPGPVR